MNADAEDPMDLKDEPQPEDVEELEHEEETKTVRCPSCGAEVYEDAERCPKCGDYVEPGGVHKVGRVWVWIVLVLILAAIVFLVWANH
jgi:uncharacterized OB-fold protein